MKKIFTTCICFFIVSCWNDDPDDMFEKQQRIRILWGMCRVGFESVENIDYPGLELPDNVHCSRINGFSATAVKANPYWFYENGYQYLGTSGTPYHWDSIRPSSTWRLSDMKGFLAGSIITVKSSSSSSSCYDGGRLHFKDENGSLLSSVLFPCRGKSITSVTIPDATAYISLTSGDWGCSVLINRTE